MGTRHLTVVILDKQFRIAQYGQFDGYPRERGAQLLALLKEIPRKAFEAKLRTTTQLTQPELQALDKQRDALLPAEQDAWWREHPELGRDLSVDILQYVWEQPEGLKLINNIEFAAESLHCEWCYVVDLDNNRFEVYTGFNKTRLTVKDRFHFLDNTEVRARAGADSRYHPVKLKAEWPLDQLPTEEVFLNTSDPVEEDDK